MIIAVSASLPNNILAVIDPRGLALKPEQIFTDWPQGTGIFYYPERPLARCSSTSPKSTHSRYGYDPDFNSLMMKKLAASFLQQSTWFLSSHLQQQKREGMGAKGCSFSRPSLPHRQGVPVLPDHSVQGGPVRLIYIYMHKYRYI